VGKAGQKLRLLGPFWLLLAGFGGGVTGSVAGLASLVSYPALLAAGLSPVSANVTNSVALVFSSLGSVWGFRPELRGQAGTVRRLAPFAIAGGAAGGLLLLATPSVAITDRLASLAAAQTGRPRRAGYCCHREMLNCRRRPIPIDRAPLKGGRS
jgi:uncharacterized membrane protein YfcA